MSERKNAMVKLGDKVRDRVTGLTGIATGMTLWLSGCWRIVVQPPVDKDGKSIDSISVDVFNLELLESNVVPNENRERFVIPEVKTPADNGGPNSREVSQR